MVKKISGWLVAEKSKLHMQYMFSQEHGGSKSKIKSVL
jgi:hypothetical protein